MKKFTRPRVTGRGIDRALAALELTSVPLCVYFSVVVEAAEPGAYFPVQGEPGAIRFPSGRRHAGEWCLGHWRMSASEVSSFRGKASGQEDALHKTKGV
ncbi:hypothetical protein [Rhizobium leguminosarum]|uniref:hypothetical protein n=1 Tax=Rhizobium leguminosarum TaxID=384 RepID=UPI0013E95751|nr:hypothetical protein [Rhizobium leguminosarum]